LRDLIVAALETGCRRGELQSPTWSQIRWTDNILLLPANKTKTNQPRAIPNDIATSRDAGDAQARPHRTRVPTERIRVWERSRRTSQEHQGRMEERLLASRDRRTHIPRPAARVCKPTAREEWPTMTSGTGSGMQISQPLAGTWQRQGLAGSTL
jgi:integrase